MGFQRFQFAVHRNTHRARCPFDNRFRRMAVSPMQACKLFETAVEDLFRTGQVIATPPLSRYRRELDPGPEFVLERFSFTRGRVKDTRSLNNDSPEAIEKPIKINMISFTRRLAFRNKSRIFMSVTA